MTQTHTEQEWLDKMVLELRLLNVSGVRIGDAAATASEHLADSGESPEEAFGDPTEYARSLGLEQPEPTGLFTVVAVNLVGLFGFMALITAAGPASEGQSFEISGFHLLVAAAFLLVLPLVAFNLRTVVRLKAWQAAALGAAVCALLVVAGLLLGDAVVAELPALPVAIGGGLLTLATTLWGQFSRHLDPDPVLDPRAATGPDRAESGRSAAWISFLGNWCLVIGAVIMVPVAVWLHRLSG
ncbi:hypothetical protein ACMX2H_13465 [Arthrobacter sulfonylureivorans]|uniref:hypothetical protein n=1 Tax=Arthrobacter sulfonylureivorans TaxID=2486855 RepID=UPI0039E51B2B